MTTPADLDAEISRLAQEIASATQEAEAKRRRMRELQAQRSALLLKPVVAGGDHERDAGTVDG